MFNDYVWENYLNAGGRAVSEMFEKNLTGGFSEEYADEISALHKEYCPSKHIINSSAEQLLDLFNDLNSGICILESGEYTIKTAMESFYMLLKGEEQFSAQKIFDCFSGSVDYFTTFLALEIPTLFVPYYFQFNFNVFEKIALEFGIELPPIPVKKDYEGRFYYYGEICAALVDFREEHNMSPYELCAFLYDFAPKYIGGVDSYIKKDLPEPKSAFFIGGSKDDIFLEEKADVVTCWQCNPDVEAGDIAVMYLRTPISAVDSVWRCVSDGFIDPFFYYYRCTYIAKPEKLKRITQKQLEKDEIFKDFPIVRKNMQGINGVELSPSLYNHLLDMAKSDLKRLEYTVSQGNVEILSEKDVENKLIKPLLEKLGYKDNEYTQQFRIEIGNHNNTLIPDFLVMPSEIQGRQSAFSVIEAKIDIPGSDAFEEVKIQARSYGRQTLAKYVVIADKNKIWVSSRDDDYVNDIFICTWDELAAQADVLSALNKLIGRKASK